MLIRHALPAVAAAFTFTATSANAATNFVEMQTAVEPIVSSIRAQMRAQKECPAPFPCPIGNGLCIVDHINLPDGATMRDGPNTNVTINTQVSMSAPSIELLLPFDPKLKTVECVEDANCAPGTYLPSIPMNIVLGVTLQSSSLCMSVVDLEPAVPGSAGIVAELQQKMGTECQPLDVASLAGALNQPVAGMGLSTNSSHDRLAIRIELGNPTSNTFTDWQSFLVNRQISAFPNGTAWSTFLGQAALKKNLLDQIHSGVNGDDRLEMTINPSASWVGSRPGFNVHFGVEYDVPGCLKDVDVEPIDITTTFGLSGDGTAMVINGHVDANMDQTDLFLCGLSMGGVFGAIIPGIVPSMMIIGNSMGAPMEMDGCSSNDDNFSCTQDLDLPGVATASFGNSNGFAIGGGNANSTYVPDPALSAVNASDINYGVQGGCSSLHLGYASEVVITGGGLLCGHEKQNDPLNVFRVVDKYASPWLPKTLEVDFPWGSASTVAQYWANPYPLEITVMTDRGSKTISIPAPQQVSQSEQLGYVGQLTMAQANCLKDQPDGIGRFMFDPQWHIDPPPFDIFVYDGLANYSLPATLRSLSVELVGDVDGTVSRRQISIDQQEAMVHGVLETNIGGEDVAVPFSVSTELSMAGVERTAGLLTEMSLTQALSASVQVALPNGLGDASFDLSVDPQALNLVGTMPALSSSVLQMQQATRAAATRTTARRVTSRATTQVSAPRVSAPRISLSGFSR